MASDYSNKSVTFPTLAVVMEENIWEYGKEKTKAKINIPVLMPLQELAPTVSMKENLNSLVKDKKIEKTVNYVEIFLPDSLYTYPVEGNVKNKNQKLYGAKSTNKLDNGKNGSKVKGMIRKVDQYTKLVILIVDGEARAENIKVLFKFDDYENENGGKKNGVSQLTNKSALR